ncbi:hypothetical protein CPC08DRAFT_544633 [Agrocybe pediades]|nr:hypothetical protein CPC08DRAFT_544633 [Agrocybe pediades]
MANLPPRPKTPPRLTDDRRLPIDDRDRGRRSAQPMAPPRFRDRDGERPYQPAPRRLDTYVPGGYDRRDADRRDYDSRDRPRDFDRDRDRRPPPRDRDFNRSPRRRSPDRDRRPYERDRERPSYRKPPSPFRRFGPGPPRRDSRSPPPRRRFSPSPPTRSRYRTRSRSPRRLTPPYKRVRLGKHSIETSPRPRSPPYRRGPSRDRSPSPHKRTTNGSPLPSRGKERSGSRPPASDSLTNKETAAVLNEENSTVKVEPHDSKAIVSHTEVPDSVASVEAGEICPDNDEKTDIVIKKESDMEQTRGDPIASTGSPVGSTSLLPAKPDATRSSTVPTPEIKAVETVEEKMDVVDSSPMKDSPAIPTISYARRSPPPIRSPRHYDHRAVPTGPQRNRHPRSPPSSTSKPRSPPRAPRNFPRPITAQNSSSSSHPPRETRRSYQQESQFSGPMSAKIEHEVRLPKIPKYQPPRYMVELELELAKHPHRTSYTPQFLQQIIGLQRSLHELDIATIDLQAAEARRHVADSQLEKAKVGCLGIDAKDIMDV